MRETIVFLGKDYGLFLLTSMVLFSEFILIIYKVVVDYSVYQITSVVYNETMTCII